jgi:hypothetical protein
MTGEDVKEVSEVEVALIAVIKVGFKKAWNFGEIWKECTTNPILQAKFLAAVQGCVDIPGELKNMTMAKWFDLAKAALNEIMAENLALLGK